MSLSEQILLVVSILLSGFIGLRFIDGMKKFSRIWLSFGGAFLVGITFLHLFPWIYTNNFNDLKYWLVGGFFLQVFLEQITSGVEHGHVHTHNHGKTFFFQIMLGLCVHSMAEGLALGGYHDLVHDTENVSSNFNPLLFGIIFHHVPAAIALVLVLANGNISRNYILTAVLVFALMPLFGYHMQSILSLNSHLLSIFLALVAGSFLHVSTTILFETDEGHKFNLKAMLAAFFGLVLAVLSLLG